MGLSRCWRSVGLGRIEGACMHIGKSRSLGGETVIESRQTAQDDTTILRHVTNINKKTQDWS
jgi:hypothetical protein